MRAVRFVIMALLAAMSASGHAAKACKCLYTQATKGTGPVQIETCLLGYREKGTRSKRVTHVRQIMRNVGERALTLHFSDERYSFNPIVSINGAKAGCRQFKNVLGGILVPQQTDGGPPPPPWVPSQQQLAPGAQFSKQYPITRFFECAPSPDDSHFVHIKTDHEYVLAGEKYCAPGTPECRNPRAQPPPGAADFPDVRLAVVDPDKPQCVVQ